MIAAIWIVVALLLVLWTAGMWIAASLARWTAGALAAGNPPEPFPIQDALGTAAPEWLTLWIGPVLLQWLQDGYSWASAAFGAMLPWAGAAVGWMGPLIWGVWFIVAVSLLALAAVAHILVRRVGRLDLSQHAARLRTF